MRPTSRRRVLQVLSAAAATGLMPLRPARAAPSNDARLIVIVLRGGLDGLAAVPPLGDPGYGAARGALAFAAPGAAGGALPLDGLFGLHPSLPGLHARYQAGELLIVHAAATPYRERSHFDAQDLLENGTPAPHGARDGWLNRALLASEGRAGRPALAVGQNVPLILRGPAKVTSWAPSALPSVDEDTLIRLMDLYADDPLLGPALAQAAATDALLAETGMDEGGRGPGARNPRRLAAETAKAAGTLLAAADGPRVAVLEMSGFDSHANQGTATGGLALRLAALDDAVAGLREALGPAWRQTMVLALTEFGRTVSPNGTKGTDHGTAGAHFLVGGAVKGGRVLADWPGLAPSARHEGRDLRPTTDVRALAKGVAVAQFALSPGVLAETVFPGSAGVPPLGDLRRA